MTKVEVAPYGSWRSPITSDLIVAGSIRLGEVQRDGDVLYWLEGRPSEEGRSVLVRRATDGTIADVTPPPFNVRTRVHEYGGGSYLVANGAVYFSNFADNRMYILRQGQSPQPLTPESPYRFAHGASDERRNRSIWVREDHSPVDREPINSLVAIPNDGGEQQVLVEGNDFYSSPRVSQDGSRLAWLTWNHPNMPWDESELWVAELAENGAVRNPVRVAGGKDESIFQPEWSAAGDLFFVSDRTGWWNIYRWHTGETNTVVLDEAEYGLPQWVFDQKTYDFIHDETLLAVRSAEGRDSLQRISVPNHQSVPIQVSFTSIASPVAASTWAAFIGGSPSESQGVRRLDLVTGRVETVRKSVNVSIDEAYISVPRPIEFPTENGLTAHAFYYPPHNPDYMAPDGELPPLIVRSHGGPTSQSSSVLNLSHQFWTSRGFALLDVNYGGSTGYGRAYRERLNGQWGVVDIDDCVNGARYLVRQGLADPKRLIIVGGSAGGYTSLGALTFRDVFSAGASYFGLADLEPFVADTHKFESRYLERLIGPYPAERQVYRDRSPINFADNVWVPVILFQGLDDKVVPPNQAEIMVDGLKRNGIPYAYLAYEGEGHGFRRAENIKRTLDAELYFYSRIFGFPRPESIEPVEIVNLETGRA